MMKKRVLSLLLALVMCLGMVPAAGAIEIPNSGICGDNLTYTLEDGVLTISGTGDMYSAYPNDGDPELPWVKGTGLDRNIKKVIIEDGLTSVGASAFSNILEFGLEITLPAGVTHIDEFAFSSSYLASISIPSSVTEIRENAFSMCNELKDVYYSGTSSQWEAINIADKGNEALNVAAVHCSDGLDTNKFTVNFLGNDYSITGFSKKAVRNGEPYGYLPTPSKSGYIFAGWFTAKEGGDEITSSTIVNLDKDQRLYPHWLKNAYTITFNANGGNVSQSSKSVQPNGTYGALPTPTRDRYAFVGWYTDPTGGIEVTSSSAVDLNDDQTLYAHWASAIQVNLDPNGGRVTPSTLWLAAGSPYGNQLPVPSREGWSFNGWYSSKEVLNRITEGSIVRGESYNINHITLTAHWTSNTLITVTFDANGGSVSPAEKTYRTSDYRYGTLPTPVWPGHTFTGWSSTLNRKNIVFDRADGSHTQLPIRDHTLYARWDDKDTYTVTLDANGGSVSPSSMRFFAGDPIGSLPTPVRSGYTFDGWYTFANGGTEISDTDRYGYEPTIYAHWTPTSAVVPSPTPAPNYTVTFNANGGSVTPGSKSVTVGQTYGALPTPTRTGYNFDGWYTARTGGSKVAEGDTVSLTANQTLYAHWTQEVSKTYTVTFNPNGGSVSTRSKKVTEKEPYGDLPTPSRKGYNFVGWFTEAEGGSQVYGSFTVQLTANQTLYAHWTAYKTYTVTFDPTEGTVEPTSMTVTEQGTYGDLPTPTREGYTFEGWYTRASGGRKVSRRDTVESKDHTLYARWSAKTYTVTFDAAGGSVSIRSKTVAMGQSYGDLPTPTRVGHTFGGWYTARTGGTQVTADTIVNLTSSQTLYARWNAKAFTVTFEPNGGIVATGSKAVTAGQSYGELPTPTREGYTFVGWFTDGMGGAQITAASTVTLSANQTLYAHWTAYRVYTVTFDPGEGILESRTKTITEKGTYGTLPTPRRDGYEFLGWYTAQTGGNQVFSSTRINERDHTLYARWKVIPPKTFTVTFNAYGGTVSPKSKTVTEKETYGELPTPTRTGYTFDGWFTAASGGNEVKADTPVALTANQTLYAHWSVIPPKTYTVAFDPNGGEVTEKDKTVTAGEAYGTLPTPTRESHTFEGWYTAKENGTKVESYTKVALEADQTLYAHWKKVDKAFVVTLDPNGGTVTPASLSMKGLVAYRSLPTPTRTGYTFGGWYTAKDGGEKVTSATVPSREEDHTLYARWTTRTFTVTLNVNGGQLSGDTTRTLSYGQSYGNLPTPTRPGYTFDGWYTSYSAGSKVEADTLFTSTVNQTLYAHWTAGSYTVTLDPDGGTASAKTLTVTNGKTYGTLPTPSREGYKFLGWYTEKSGGSKVVSSTKVAQAQDHTLYARWQANTYKVYFYVNGWNEASMSVTYGSPYGSLYTPTREGYTFDGWYTAETGGDRVTESALFRQAQNQKLYARWKSFTVRFDPNGGSVSTQSKSVVGGGTYGDLPTPTRKGYTFEGWYTAREGGSRVHKDSTYSQKTDQTLYAHWLPYSTRPTFDALTYWDIYNWGGSRNYGGFGYPENYRMPYERYVVLYGDNELAKQCYNDQPAWGGNCYGMSATASMFFQNGNDVTLSSFRNGASKLSQLDLPDRNSSWNMTLLEFIECMQISQGCSMESTFFANNIDKLVEEVRAFQSSGNNPVMFLMSAPTGGHAVVAYDVVDAGNRESHLMIYDPNFPQNARYVTLYKDNAGQYTGWYYKMNDIEDWGSNYGCDFNFRSYVVFYQPWAERNTLANVNRSLLRVNANAAVIKDSNGDVVAEIRDGKLVTDRDDIYEMLQVGVTTDNVATQNDTLAIWLPTDLYTITNEDETIEAFEATMTNVDQSAAISTAASTVTFAVADEQQMNYVEVNEPEKDYEITLNSTLENTHEEVVLTGKTQTESTALAQLAGKLYATGTELTSGETLRIDNKEASAEALSQDAGDIQLRLGRADDAGEETQQTSFEDVAEKDWYYDAVAYVCDSGLMNGTGKTTFGPAVSTTRGMIATILYRLSGEPDAAPADFTDVPEGQWYSKAVAWAAESGIAGGYGDGRFGPNDLITREQLAAMLYRYAGSPLTTGDISGFRDSAQAGDYAVDALRWAVEEGIISGKTGGLLDPKGQATRAEVATILMRYCQIAQDMK